MPKSLNWHLFHKSGALEFLNEGLRAKELRADEKRRFKFLLEQQQQQNSKKKKIKT